MTIIYTPEPIKKFIFTVNKRLYWNHSAKEIALPFTKYRGTKKNYSNYINKYITPDGKNIGYKKIIKIIKKRFF